MDATALYQAHRRLEKRLGFKLETVNESGGKIYFWPESLGYTGERSISDQLDRHLWEQLRFKYDYARVYPKVAQFFSAVSKARAKVPIGLYTPLVLASLFTNAFRYVPALADGTSSHNYFRLPGDQELFFFDQSFTGAAFESAEACLITLATELGTTESEDVTFMKFYKRFNFSLPLYRTHFLLTLLTLKGERVDGKAFALESLQRLDCSGRSYTCRNRRLHPKWSEETFSTKGRRPRGTGAQG